MERGYHDVVVDPRRYRLNVPPSLARMLGRILPRPDLTILLVGEPSLLHARKQELLPMEIARQQGAWSSIGSSLGRIAVVDADGSVESVTGAALEAILAVRSEALAPTARRTPA
jgi:hypothetical protein